MKILFVILRILWTPIYVVWAIIHSIVAFIQFFFEDMDKWFKGILDEF